MRIIFHLELGISDFSPRVHLSGRKPPLTPMTIDTKEGIALFRMLTIKSALSLETKGLKGRQPVAPLAREILTQAGKKAPRNKVELLAELTAYIESMRVTYRREARLNGEFCRLEAGDAEFSHPMFSHLEEVAQGASLAIGDALADESNSFQIVRLS